ncbi:hypothetical protein [Brevibacterium picturae]
MSKNPDSSLPPVSMPTVVLTVAEDGTITVTVDDTPLPPPPDLGVWRRSAFPQIIDLASQDRAFPVRVEVHENDGTTFTDIVPAITRRTPDPLTPEPDTDPDTASATSTSTDDASPAPAHSGQSGSVEVTATRMGFIPGEAVTVAVVTTHTEAGETGTVQVRLDRDLLDGLETGEVILVGRTSGVLGVRVVS